MQFKKPFISGLLAITLLFNLLIPAFAYNSTGSTTDRTEGSDEVQEMVTEYYDGINASTADTDVYATRASTFTALVPKTIILNGSDGLGTYVVGAKGDVLAEDSVSIEPASYELTLQKVEDPTKTTLASITQEQTSVTGTDIENVSPAYATIEGSIQAQDLKAGSWKSTMTFNIGLTNTNVPVHKHTLTHVAAVETTEKTAGNIEYWHCTDCDKYYRDAGCTEEITLTETIIPQLEHTHNLTHTEAVSATEESTGNIEFWYCDKCGKYYSDESCLNEISQEDTILAELPHVHNLTYTAGVPATEEHAGNIEYWHCDKCDKYYSDAECLNEVSLEQINLPQLPHTHNIVHVAAKNPTATEDGNVEYWYCSKCGKYYSDAKGANETNVNDITIVPIPFTITSSNKSKVGYKGTTNESLVIPDVFKNEDDGNWYKVTVIDEEAFRKCTELTSIIIPNSVTSIGKLAFGNCTSLTSITIPKNITSIGDMAFFYCLKLTSINVDESNPNYSSKDGVLFNKNKTTLIQYPISKTGTSYIIPDTVTDIGPYAFYSCNSLTSVEISNNITNIGRYAFGYCNSLTSVKIGNNVTNIDDYAFTDCSSLTSITIPDSVTSIGKMAFANCELLRSATIGNSTIKNSVTTIGDSAFYSCTSLETVTIGDNVTTIGPYAFHCCRSLESIIIPANVTSIGNGAFNNCNSLTSIKFGSRNVTIGSGAFMYCESLKSVTIPASVTNIGHEAFASCPKLASINVDESNPNYSSKDGVLFNKNKTILIQYPRGKAETTYTIPNSVTSIDDDAFNNCTSLKSITMPNSLISIGNMAFVNCVSLTSITIPNSVANIEPYAFNYCSSSTIIVPNSVTSVGKSAFYNVPKVIYNGTLDTSNWGAKSITTS